MKIYEIPISEIRSVGLSMSEDFEGIPANSQIVFSLIHQSEVKPGDILYFKEGNQKIIRRYKSGDCLDNLKGVALYYRAKL